MTENLRKSLLHTYGIADFAFVLMVNMEVYYFSAFLTDYARFSLGTVGWILFTTSFFDIGCALAAGIILQKVTLRFGGKYRSWFLGGPPAVAVLFLLQFTKFGDDTLAAVIIVTGFLSSHLIWNIMVTAGGAMVGRLSTLPRERTILSASRAQGMSAAGLVFSATALPMMAYFGERTNDITGITITVGVYNLVMILGYWYIFRITAGSDPYDEAVAARTENSVSPSIWEILAFSFKNPPLWGLMLAEVFRNSYVLILTAFAYYYFKYVLDKFTLLSVFILAISIARLSGTLVSSWVGNRIGKRTTYWLSLVLAAAGFGQAIFFSDNVWGFTAIFCFASMLGIIAGSLSTVLFSDSVVYGEWKTGRNNRAFIMSLQSLTIKLAILIRAGVLTLGLSAIGFEANAVAGEGVVKGIRSIMIFAPAAACAISALLFFLGYRIDEEKVLRMQDEIEARKLAGV